MAKSTGTPPVSGLDADLVRYAQDYARQVTAPAPTGYGKAALRGVPRGAFGMLQSFANAAQANPSYAALDASLAMAGVPGAQPFAQTGEDLANRIAPPPTTTGPAMLEAGVAGGVGGVPFGPLGVASGVAGGLGAQGAAEMGGGPVAQLLAGLAAGMIPGGIASLRANRGPQGAAHVMQETAALDDKTLPQALQSQPSTPGALGIDRMGRTGRALATRVAGEGGAPADELLAAVTQQGEGAGDRVLAEVSKAFRTRPRDPNVALREVRRAAQAADARNYTPAMLSREIPIDTELAFLLDDPVIQRAYAAREQVAQTRVSGPMGAPTNEPLPPLYEITVDPATGQPRASLASSLSIRALNEIKKGLDDLARPAADGSKQITQAQAQAAQTRLTRIRERLTDPKSPTYQPDYAQALAEHAGIMRGADATKAGWQAFGTTIKLPDGRRVAATPEELRRLATEFGPKRPYMLLSMLERVRQTGANLTPEQIQRIEAVLPPGKTVGEVVAAIGREGERASTRAAVQGASRGLRTGADMNLERSVADVGAQRFKPAFRDAILAFMRRGQTTRLPQPIRERIAQVLAQPDGPAFQAAAQQVLDDLAVLESIRPRAAASAMLGAAGASDATRTRRGSRPD